MPKRKAGLRKMASPVTHQALQRFFTDFGKSNVAFARYATDPSGDVLLGLKNGHIWWNETEKKWKGVRDGVIVVFGEAFTDVSDFTVEYAPTAYTPDDPDDEDDDKVIAHLNGINTELAALKGRTRRIQLPLTHARLATTLAPVDASTVPKIQYNVGGNLRTRIRWGPGETTGIIISSVLPFPEIDVSSGFAFTVEGYLSQLVVGDADLIGGAAAAGLGKKGGGIGFSSSLFGWPGTSVETKTTIATGSVAVGPGITDLYDFTLMVGPGVGSDDDELIIHALWVNVTLL
jgi:hypothetical protein